MFMGNLHAFTMAGVNKFDDAPDSLAGLCDMIRCSAKKTRVADLPLCFFKKYFGGHLHIVIYML